MGVDPNLARLPSSRARAPPPLLTPVQPIREAGDLSCVQRGLAVWCSVELALEQLERLGLAARQLGLPHQSCVEQVLVLPAQRCPAGWWVLFARRFLPPAARMRRQACLWRCRARLARLARRCPCFRVPGRALTALWRVHQGNERGVSRSPTPRVCLCSRTYPATAQQTTQRVRGGERGTGAGSLFWGSWSPPCQPRGIGGTIGDDRDPPESSEEGGSCKAGGGLPLARFRTWSMGTPVRAIFSSSMALSAGNDDSSSADIEYRLGDLGLAAIASCSSVCCGVATPTRRQAHGRARRHAHARGVVSGWPGRVCGALVSHARRSTATDAERAAFPPWWAGCLVSRHGNYGYGGSQVLVVANPWLMAPVRKRKRTARLAWSTNMLYSCCVMTPSASFLSRTASRLRTGSMVGWPAAPPPPPPEQTRSL